MNTIAGIDIYELIFWALCFHRHIFFKALWVDMVWVWQPWCGELSVASLACHGKVRAILMEPQNTSWTTMEITMSTRKT